MKYTNFRPAGCHAHRKLYSLVSKVTLGINNFSVVWIENLSNFKHFHISAMSNNRITADYEFFCEMAVVTAARPSRRRSFDRFNQRHLSSFGRYTGCLPLTYNTNGIDTLYISPKTRQVPLGSTIHGARVKHIDSLLTGHYVAITSL